MRYWHPRAAAALPAVRGYGPDEIVALPLYPQFSMTTSGSSLGEWRTLAGGDTGLRAICCHPLLEGLIEAWADPLAAAIGRARAAAPVRVLFTAHGLPERCDRERRPLCLAGRADGRRAPRRRRGPAGRPRRRGLARDLAEPRHAGKVAPAGHRSRSRGRRAGGPCAGARPDCLRVGAFGNPGRARHRIPRCGRARRRCGLGAGGDAGYRILLYRGSWRTLCSNRRPQRRICPASCTGCPAGPA